MSSYVEAKSKGATSPPYQSMSFIGFDPSKKQLVRTDMDGMGGIAHASSPGWVADALVFTGKYLHDGTEMRETFQKAGKDIKHTVEFKAKDGPWFTMVENACK